MNPSICISDLYSMKKKKEGIRTQTFNKILEKCHNKIKIIAEQGGMNVFFEIPFFLLGYPLYDVFECCEYIVDCLRKNGLMVQVLPHPNDHTIYISWKPTDVKIRKSLPNTRFL